MSIAQDFVCDRALELFVKTQECPEIYFSFTCTNDYYKTADMFIRQSLHTIMWAVMRLQNKETSHCQKRMILEELPNIIKSCGDLTSDVELKESLARYFEEVMDLFQLIASDLEDTDAIINSVDELKLDTIKLIEDVRKKIEPPFVVEAFEFHQRKLKEQLGEYLDTESDDRSEVSCQEIFNSNTDGIYSQLKNQNLNESTTSISSSETEVVENKETDGNLVVADSNNLAASRNSENTEIEINLPDSDTNISDCESLSVKEANLTCTSVGEENVSAEEESVSSSAHDVESSMHGDSVTAESETSFETLSSQSGIASSTEASISSSYFGGSSNTRRNFSIRSDCMLIHGFQQYSKFRNKWSRIHSSYKFPSYRKPSHLKDRWRTLTQNEVVELEEDKVKVLKEDLSVAYDEFVANLPTPKKPPIPVIKLLKTSSSNPPPPPKSSSIRTRSSFKEDQSERGSISNTSRSTSSPLNSSPQKSPSTQSHSADEVSVLTSSSHRTRSTSIATPRKASTQPSPEPADRTTQLVEVMSNDDEESTTLLPKRKRRRRLWEGDGVALTWDDDDDPISQPPKSPPSSLSKQTPPRRSHGARRKKRWLDWEVRNLLKGIRRHGVGQWAMIQDQFKFSNRNPVMLKDKYRNMLKNEELPRDLM